MFQEVPEGAPNCLAGLTFVISGTLDRYSYKSLDLHQAEVSSLMSCLPYLLMFRLSFHIQCLGY